MMKKIILLLIIFNIRSYCESSNYIGDFYEYFKNCILNCERKIRILDYKFIERNNASDINESNKDSTLSIILDAILRQQQCFPENKGINLNDEKIVAFLVNIVFDTKIGMLKRAIAADFLKNKVTYKSLEKYKQRFIDSIEEFYKLEKFSGKRELLVLLNPDEMEREKLKFKKSDMKYYSDKVRARLGDAEAISELKKQFEKNPDYSYKKDALEALIYSGNKELLKYCIKHFNKPFIRETAGCKSTSIRYTIIRKLSYYYPEEQLLNEEFRKATQI